MQTEVKNIECPTCGESFDSKKGMKCHHALSHGESIRGEIYQCDWCGGQYREQPSNERGDHNFCDLDCYSKWRSKNITSEACYNFKGEESRHECDMCGKMFREAPANRSSDHSFCGQDCYSEWQSKYRTGGKHPSWSDEGGFFECDYCSAEVYREPRKVENHKRFFCSRGCHGQWQSENRTGESASAYLGHSITVPCGNCGSKIERFKSRVEQFDNLFCSKSCYGEWATENRTGEKHPNWKGGHRTYYGASWQRQRRKALERDNYECVVCGSDDNVHVHHVNKFRDFGLENHQRANRLNNLACLCAKHHREWEGIPLNPALSSTGVPRERIERVGESGQ